MKIERLYLENFLNYQTLDLSVGPHINIFQGPNAQGKSNLLDGIYYLSRAASYRHPKDSELIRWGESFFRLKVRAEKEGRTEDVTITYLEGKRGIFHNNNRMDTISKHLGHLVTVIFSPEDLYLIKGGPAGRRAFMDGELVQSSAPYARELYRYKKVLIQRNQLLKSIRKKQSEADLLDVYDEQLAGGALYLWQKRQGLIDDLSPRMQAAHQSLTQGQEELTVHYLGPGQQGLSSVAFQEALRAAREDDILRGYSSLGPHRDDFTIFIQGRDCRKYGSQGQQRTAALSLKMAEVSFLASVYGHYPILLLDDVLSELDGQRRAQLLELVSRDLQTFITCTDLDDLAGLLTTEDRHFYVVNGQLSQQYPPVSESEAGSEAGS